MGQALKIHPDYSLINNRPEIECSRALVCTVSSHVNKNGSLQERNIQIKIVVIKYNNHTIKLMEMVKILYIGRNTMVFRASRDEM